MQRNKNYNMNPPYPMYSDNMNMMGHMMPNMPMPEPHMEMKNIINRLNILEKRVNILESGGKQSITPLNSDSNFYIV